MKSKVENGEVIEEFRKKFVLSMNETFFGNVEELKKQGWEVGNDHFIIKQDTKPEDIEAFITNALNQQRINLIKEILESKEVNALGLELPFPVWQSFKEFLTKLEK